MMTYFFKTHMTRLRKAGGAMAIFLVALSSCGGSDNGSDRNFPGNFMSIGDAGRVAYVMEHATPDSVARFICDAALGKVKGAKIDTLATATLHAYENYRDSNLVVFSETFDNYSNSLPLPEKMKILSMAGLNDPQGLGYELGLAYVGSIRERRMTEEEVAKEIEALRQACASDTAMFTRFLIGFHTVLKIDSGKDLPASFYNRFIDYK